MAVPMRRCCGGCGNHLAPNSYDGLCALCQRRQASFAALTEPPELPLEFWTADPMFEALATRHMGKVIRTYRSCLGGGTSGSGAIAQETVAHWLGVTQALLSRAENGDAPTDLRKLAEWAQTLKIPDFLLWFKLPGRHLLPGTWPNDGDVAPRERGWGPAASGQDEMPHRQLEGLAPRLETLLGLGFIADQTVFSLSEVWTQLGIDTLIGRQLEPEGFLLAPFLRRSGNGTVTATHPAFQEYFASRLLRTVHGRAAAFDVHESEPVLTEQIRRLLQYFGAQTPAAPPLVLPAGIYVVGPSHRLLLRKVENSVIFDEFPVTVSRYRRFLAAVERWGCAAWDHPDTPAGHSHEPWHERLRNREYFTDPQYDDHPITCISWWSAYAFAWFEGKRLPTSLEWEAAARGADGRLFPWGDTLDLTAVNCADAWSSRPLVTYRAWKEEIDGGGLRDSGPTAVTEHPANVSPFGVREMSGNVWEWTGTVFDAVNSAVVCGGSYDSPYRAVQTSSKALYVRRGCSNAVGFRCVRDAA